ncbi:hypothetical protein [Variovorax paradoxus]|uniref:hypothetical protein n=1 Tax=Variovorax paradoxus TaxID=34073 RepID=UPI002782D32F|nr:hypothetical protein [Variovorax paradoxus]MDQ0591370.1 hypothetical protein [Variovorax paradoxus]
MQPLCRIAVTVVEEEEGAYRWRLIELEGEGWHSLNQQSRSVKTYKAAMAAGLLELQKMVEDLDVGPREEELEPAKPKKSGSVFGFGFGLPKMG